MPTRPLNHDCEDVDISLSPLRSRMYSNLTRGSALVSMSAIISVVGQYLRIRSPDLTFFLIQWWRISKCLVLECVPEFSDNAFAPWLSVNIFVGGDCGCPI